MTDTSTGAAKRIVNWRDYNRALTQRGSLTFWFSEEVAQQWYHRGAKSGRGLHKTYSDTAIQTCLMLKALFGLPLRALEGFVGSLIEPMALPVSCPDSTLIAKRARHLNLTLPRRRPTGPVDIVVDSTGLKVYGEGEWKTRQQGVGKRRTWRKRHLAVDPATHEVAATLLTTVACTDAEVLPELLEQLGAQPLGRVHADGADDQRRCDEAMRAPQGYPLIPPREDAVAWEAEHPRTQAVAACREVGRKAWKQQVGYHRRRLAETAVYRYQQLIAPRLRWRHFDSQVAKADAGVAVLNRMNTLGLPKRA
jgi:hypothetical protein